MTFWQKTSCFISVVVAISAIVLGGIKVFIWTVIALAVFVVPITMPKGKNAARPTAAKDGGRRTRRSVSDAKSSGLQAAGFRVVEEDGDAWHERQVQLDGRNATISLSADPEIASRSLSAAQQIIDDPQRFLSAIARLIEREAGRLPGVKSAKVVDVSFFTTNTPGLGEVFLEDGDGNAWACTYEDGHAERLNAAD